MYGEVPEPATLPSHTLPSRTLRSFGRLLKEEGGWVGAASEGCILLSFVKSRAVGGGLH